MKVNLEKQGENVVLLDLEVETEKAQRAYDLACRNLGHKVNIPGFRKGKIPKNIIERSLGHDFIKQETLEHLIPQVLEEVILSEKLDLVVEPKIDSYEFELGKPLKLQAKLEVRPEVKLGEYHKIKVEVPQAQVTEDAIELALKNIAQSKASLSKVSDRPVAMGDTVELDFTCSVDDKLVDDGKAEGFLLEVKESNFIEGFCEQLVGKKPGDKFDVQVTLPANYRQTELAGKKAVFQVELKELKKLLIPEINDELARVVGCESLAALETLLRERLDEEVSRENEARKQQAILSAVVAGAIVDIPETMIKREKELLLSQYRKLIEHNGKNWDEFQQDPEFIRVDEEKSIEARQRVLASLVLGTIVKNENFNITQDELESYIQSFSTYYGVPLEKITGNARAYQRIMDEALTDKVVEYLVSNAEVKYIPESLPVTVPG